MDVSPRSEALDQPAPTSAPDPTTAPSATQTSRIDRPRVERFRRGFERLRSASEASTEDVLQNEEEDRDLTLHLLREENARLKAERHRPPDVGTMIDQLRRIAAEQGDESANNTWTLLTECLLIREELDQACIEIKAAIDAVQARLGRLQIKLDDTGSHPSPSADPRDPGLLEHERINAKPA